MTDFTDQSDQFLFATSDATGDGAADSIWIDPGPPVDGQDGDRLVDSGGRQDTAADDGPTCDPSANPVLIVVSNPDFWFNE